MEDQMIEIFAWVLVICLFVVCVVMHAVWVRNCDLRADVEHMKEQVSWRNKVLSEKSSEIYRVRGLLVDYERKVNSLQQTRDLHAARSKEYEEWARELAIVFSRRPGLLEESSEG